MMRVTPKDHTYIMRLLLDMLLAHKARGRGIEDIISYLDRVIAKREKDGLA